MYEHIYFLGTGRVASKCIEILTSRFSATNILQCLGVEHESMSNVVATCRRYRVPYRFFAPLELNDFLSQISDKSLLFSAHNQHIFPKVVIENPNLTIINFHNAYLPFYRGRNAPTWEIFHQEAFGGATWHEVDASIDTGGIIVQEKVPIESDETALSLLMKSAQCGMKLFQEHVDEFLSGKYTLYHPETVGTLFLSQHLPNGGFLDSSWGFDKSYAFLRAMDYEMLDIVPKPKLQSAGHIYEISGYTIIQSKTSIKGDETKYYIESPKSGQYICCQLERIE